jgi:hypothetical protein
MSESLAAGAAVPRRGPGLAAEGRLAALDTRRKLQLGLGLIWLLDGILQYQPFMFSKAFPQMLASTSAGNPGVISGPITWSSNLIAHHLIPLNALFATIQLAIGLGIAWRPTVKVALAASAAWALAVWWLGEGLGGMLAGSATPVNGAPGAVIIYALLAVLLWPANQDRPARFAAGRAVGQRAAQALWLVLWASLAFLALQPAARAAQGISSAISGMAPGEPGWLGWLDNHTASLLAGQGLAASILLAVALVTVAVGTYLPVRPARAAIALAIAVAAFLWMAEGFGGIFTGGGTDPNSGPLLALLALAFWPAAGPGPAAGAGPAPRRPAAATSAEGA